MGVIGDENINLGVLQFFQFISRLCKVVLCGTRPDNMPVDCYVPGTGIYQTLLKLTDRVSSEPDVMEQVGKGRIPILKEYFLYSTERIPDKSHPPDRYGENHWHTGSEHSSRSAQLFPEENMSSVFQRYPLKDASAGHNCHSKHQEKKW